MRRAWNKLYSWTGFRDKTLWNWLELLTVPLVIVGAIAVLGYFEFEKENWRTDALQKADTERTDALVKAESRRLQAQQQIEDDRVRQTLLESYMRDIAELLLYEGLVEPPPPHTAELKQQAQHRLARRIAQASTFTTLRQLDGGRKGLLLQFLYESNLLLWFDCGDSSRLPSPQGEQRCKHIPIPINMHGADLRNTVLVNTFLYGANLNGADLSNANLSRSTLEWADLVHTNLNGADLSGADLRHAYLATAELREANLRGADLRGAHLSHAYLSSADLRGANLRGATLRRAILSGANLQGAVGWTNEQLVQAMSLIGATLPNGTVMTEGDWETFKKRYR